MGIGQRIEFTRGDLSRQEFGKRIGVGKTSVQNYENKDSVPKGKVLQKICSEFNVRINWLLTGLGEPYINKDRKPAPVPPHLVVDKDGLYGKTRRHKKEGVDLSVTEYGPHGPEYNADPFGQAVAALRNIFDSEDPAVKAAILANLAAFESSTQILNELSKIRARIDTIEETIKREHPPEGIEERRKGWLKIKQILAL